MVAGNFEDQVMRGWVVGEDDERIVRQDGQESCYQQKELFSTPGVERV